jgi:hypothetical protein
METTKTKTIKIARTRSGVPCLWESLITFAELKRSTVILDKEGNAKNAVFLNADRDKQALVPIVIGDYVSKTFEDQHGIAISLFKITDISSMSNEAIMDPVYRKSSLISEYVVPAEYAKHVSSSIKKLSGEIKVISKYTAKD